MTTSMSSSASESSLVDEEISMVVGKNEAVELNLLCAAKDRQAED